MIRREKDKTRLAELENAEVYLRKAKSSRDDSSSSDFLLGMALRVIESHLPKVNIEKRRYYLTEAIHWFELAGSASDAGVLESRLRTLPTPVEVKPPEKVVSPPEQESTSIASPEKSAAADKSESRFSTLLKSGTVDDWLGSIGKAQDEGERADLRSALSLSTRDYAAPAYKSFLIACFESAIDRSSLLSLVDGADKLTRRFVEILCDLKDKGEIECFINDSPLDYTTKLLEILAGLKEADGPKTGKWEFQLSTGTTITVVSQTKKDQETGRVESYVFRRESPPTV